MEQAWFNITNKSGSVPEVNIFGPIGESLWEDGVSAKSFIAEVQALKDPKEILFNVSCVGGSVWEGYAIHDFLVRHPARKIMRVTLAASIASMIIMSGDEIQMPENGLIMIHLPQGSAYGDASELRKTAAVLDRITDGIIKVYAARTTLEESDLRAMVEKETWMNADDALKNGFIDIITKPVSMDNIFNAKLQLKEGINMSEQSDQKEIQPAAIDMQYLLKYCGSLVETIRAEAKTEERERIRAIHQSGVPGAEAVLTALMFDGEKTETDALRAMLSHQKGQQAVALAAIHADFPLPVPFDVGPESGSDDAKTIFTSKVADLMETKKISKTQAMAMIATQFPEIHKNFITAANKQ